MPGRAWLPDDVMHLIGMHGSGYPKWIGANYPFWEDLDNLREFIKGNVSRLPAQYDIIACAWLDPAPDTVASYSETGPHIGPDHEVSPAQRDAAWEFLGFDVAEASRDNTYLCYVGPGGLVRGQRTWWSSLLNDHGLFDDIETAWKLVEERRNEYPDDVPFCLFGLWLVSAVR